MKLHAWKSAILLLAVAACGGTGVGQELGRTQAPGVTQQGGLPGGGGGGGGAPQIPPPPTIDGPSWFINNASAVAGTPPTPDVNFSALQNTVQGPISVG